jgi:V-type H+-transporting ATPase subunit F
MEPNTIKKMQSLVGVIGDKDTVTGFLLAGIGQKDQKGETNYLVVDEKTTQEDIEQTFNRFIECGYISVILINQKIAENSLRPLINNYTGIIPTILEIPSKDCPYELKKDAITTKAAKLLYGTDACLED